jgi:hypothetical protein
MRTNYTATDLAAPMRLWTSYGSGSHPSREDSRIRQAYPAAEAEEILRLLKQLESDFYASDAFQRASGISEIAIYAIADFSAKHPDFQGEVPEILAWCYTFDYK